MASDPLQPELMPDEDQIADISLPSDNDDVAEDVVNPRPTFRRADQSKPTNSSETGSPKINNVQPPRAQPGQNRTPDPQKRDVVEPNKLSPSRELWNRARERTGKGLDDINQARALAGERIDQLRTARAVVENPQEAAKEYIGDQAKKEVKRVGTAAAKSGAQAAGRGIKAASGAVKVAAQAAWEAVSAAATWVIGAIGPWGVAILAIVIVLGIGIALMSQSDSGSDVQIVDMNKPGIADAVSRLAALSGDATALAQQIRENTSTVTSDLEQARTTTANAPLKDQISQEIDNATASVERIRSGGTSLTTAELTKMANSLVYSLQRISALYRGMSITTPNELVAAANGEVQAGTTRWVYSENQQTTNTSQPMRDGTNVVSGKRGCDSTGFVTYLLRGDNTRCAQCVSPTLDKIAATFSLLQPTTQTNTTNDVSYLKGDIIVANVPNQKSLEGYIVTNVTANTGNTGVEVAYCSATGPVKANLQQVLDGTQAGRKGDGKRTIQTQFRLINEQRSGLSATAGGSS